MIWWNREDQKIGYTPCQTLLWKALVVSTVMEVEAALTAPTVQRYGVRDI